MNRPILAALTLAVASAAAGALAQPSAPAMPSMPPVATNPAQMPAGHYVSDGHHTFLIMRVRHMGLTTPTMRMNKVDAAYDYDPAKPAAAMVTASIDANSLDFGDPAISTEFANKFLDAQANPKITFVSTGIKTTDATHGKMTGNLTLRGVTKPVTLDITYDGFLNAMGGRAGFSATGVVKRSDFGSTGYPPSILGDDVMVNLEIEFTKKG